MRTIILVLAVLSLIACKPGPEIASKENFAAAAQRHFDANPACYEFGILGPKAFPANMQISLGFSYSNEHRPKPELATTLAKAGFANLREFVNLGFLTAEVRETPNDNSAEPYYSLHLELTDAGRKHVSPSTTKTGFCYAKVKVLEVSGFTAPVQESSAMVSRVQILTQLSDLQPWAKGSGLGMALDATPQTREIVFVLRGFGVGEAKAIEQICLASNRCVKVNSRISDPEQIPRMPRMRDCCHWVIRCLKICNLVPVPPRLGIEQVSARFLVAFY